MRSPSLMILEGIHMGKSIRLSAKPVDSNNARPAAPAGPFPTSKTAMTQSLIMVPTMVA